MNIILTLELRVLLLVELSLILTRILDAEGSVWQCFLLFGAISFLLHICIANLVVFVTLKLTFITSKNIIKINRTGIWSDSLTIFTIDPVV